jgi:hypothetical protein
MKAHLQHSMRSASKALFLVTVFSALLMAGCHSGADNPVAPGINRTPQIFYPIGMWSE